LGLSSERGTAGLLAEKSGKEASRSQLVSSINKEQLGSRGYQHQSGVVHGKPGGKTTRGNEGGHDLPAGQKRDPGTLCRQERKRDRGKGVSWGKESLWTEVVGKGKEKKRVGWGAARGGR